MANKTGDQKPQTFKPRDPLSAAELNRILNQLTRRIQGAGGIKVSTTGAGQIQIGFDGIRKPSTILRQFVVKGQLEDALICRPLDANKVEGPADVHVLKPWLLRYSDWDIVATEGMAAPDGEIYDYDLTTYTTRTNTGLVDPEVQKITQDYYDDCVIYAMNIDHNLVVNPIAVRDADPESPVAAVFSRLIDVNVDGRAWAVA